jgi:hypothetical protein
VWLPRGTGFVRAVTGASHMFGIGWKEIRGSDVLGTAWRVDANQPLEAPACVAEKNWALVSKGSRHRLASLIPG